MELKRNDASGEFEMGLVNAPNEPKRAWVKSNKIADSFDFSFEFEGATVRAKRIGPEAHKAMKARGEELFSLGQKLKADEASLNELSQQKGVLSGEVHRRRKALTAEAESHSGAGHELNMSIVIPHVVYWKDAPVPYSEDAKTDLEPDLAAAWATIILQSSPQLSEGEENFLDHSSTTTQPAGSPNGPPATLKDFSMNGSAPPVDLVPAS